MLIDSDELGSCEGNAVSSSPLSVDGASLGEILGRVDGLALSAFDGVSVAVGNSFSGLGETDGAKLTTGDGTALGPLDEACDTGALVIDDASSLGEPLGLMDGVAE
jgi:hypothetical protein